jgi:cytochrome subunit of sulfide dehydrogenase
MEYVRMSAAAVRPSFIVAALALTALSPSVAVGDEIPAAMLAGACTACHGPHGHSPGAIPSLDRLGAADIRTTLLGYKHDEIRATVMNRIARGFSDTEIDALASYFGKATP